MMVRAYNRHGREAQRVVQITCDRVIEAEFLRQMRMANIEILPSEVDPLELLPDNPATCQDRIRLTREHQQDINAQWRQCSEAEKNEHTRKHFKTMIPDISQRIDLQEMEDEARERRAREEGDSCDGTRYRSGTKRRRQGQQQ